MVERPAVQTTITRRYTEERRQVHSRPTRTETVSLSTSPTACRTCRYFASSRFLRHQFQPRGLYGDVIEEIDWSVGQVLAAIRAAELEQNTVVVFTSDNGPWLWFQEHGGSAGPLRGGKGGTFEGGMREPTVIWGPGIVRPGKIDELGATMDLLPTFCRLAGIEPPADRPLDGHDLSAALRGTGKSPRQTVFYYLGTEVWAIRHGNYKMHLKTVEPAYGPDKTVTTHDPPLLFDLAKDIGERDNIAGANSAVIEELKARVADHRGSLQPVPLQLETPLRYGVLASPTA